MVTVNAVARRIGQLVLDSGNHMDQVKLQRLCFLAYAYYGALMDDDLVAEVPVAWPSGPVFVSLHNALQGNGSGSFLSSDDLQCLEDVKLSVRAEAVLEMVLDHYRGSDGIVLKERIRTYFPWKEARSRGQAREACELNREITYQFFRALTDAPRSQTDYAERFYSRYLAPALSERLTDEKTKGEQG